MDEPQKIQLTKMDVARRQLGAAIALWFTGGDPVAIHTLAFAAHEIIHTLFKRAGLSGLLFDSVVIKDEYRTEFAKFMTAPATFFKHARHDPEATMEYHPRACEVFLITSLHGMQRLNVRLGMEERALLMWLQIHHPSWFSENVFEKHMPLEALRQVRGINKDEFFEAYRTNWRD